MAESDLKHERSVTRQADRQRGNAHYDEFYRDGGWKYSFVREYSWHRRQVVKRFGLRRGTRILEVACGSGFHTNLLRRMGFDCVGIDRSPVGVDWARKHFPRCTYHCGDITDDLPVQRRSFDTVLARGCSHYHYDLMSEQASATTTTLLTYLKPGGVLIMVIVSDLSGRREPDKIWQNTLEDYERHFSSFGMRSSVTWVDGVAICGLYNEPNKAARSVCPSGHSHVAI